ncbi:MAG: dephospho-CoA kinase [Selenomonadaceae bacterium]|nr:dephospho-CoA kinase [Selenomonadaceae bacterium]
MKVIGLTGGIACGKSRVSFYLGKLGAGIVDADAVSHELSAPHKPLWEAYRENFGAEVFGESGELDRNALAQLVFNDEAARIKLNNLAHPIIQDECLRRLQALREAETKVAVFDVPLLYEAGWDKYADETWVVFAPPEVQLARLMARDKIDVGLAKARIEAQGDLTVKCRRADVVIDNGGEWYLTKKQLKAAWRNVGHEGLHT